MQRAYRIGAKAEDVCTVCLESVQLSACFGVPKLYDPHGVPRHYRSVTKNVKPRPDEPKVCSQRTQVRRQTTQAFFPPVFYL
jgi:hypothetical protein